MPSTFTDSLRLERQGIGENNNAWGNKLNATIDLIDKAIAGHVSVATTGGATQLSSVNNAEDQARYRILEITGTLTSDAIIEVPEVSKEYIIWDSTVRGGFTVSLRLGAAGATIAVPAVTNRAFGVSTDSSEWRPVSASLATELDPGILEIATTSEAQAGTSNALAITPSNLQSVTATETRRGVIELATGVETRTGIDTDRAVTPSGLQSLTATETRRGLIEIATTAQALTGSDNTLAITPLRLQEVTATETRRGVIEIATIAEAQAGSDNTRALTPARLQSVTATESRRGIVEIATAAEARTGTDNTRVITPAGLNSVDAKEYRKGVIEIATAAETQTGTDPTRAVTPAGLKGVMDAHLGATDPHSQYITAAEASSTGPVLSVNGSTGAVTLTSADVGAVPSSHLGSGGTQHAAATTSTRGFVELATQTEVNNGTDTTRAVVPSTLTVYTSGRLGTSGTLGSAARYDTGTAATEVPLNQDIVQQATVDVSGTFTGSFNAGESVKVTRIFDVVTISSVGMLSHDAASGPMSFGAIPTWARPTATTVNSYYAGFDGAQEIYVTVEIGADGDFKINYASAGGALLRTDSHTAFSISYII